MSWRKLAARAVRAGGCGGRQVEPLAGRHWDDKASQTFWKGVPVAAGSLLKSAGASRKRETLSPFEASVRGPVRGLAAEASVEGRFEKHCFCSRYWHTRLCHRRPPFVLDGGE